MGTCWPRHRTRPRCPPAHVLSQGLRKQVEGPSGPRPWPSQSSRTGAAFCKGWSPVPRTGPGSPKGTGWSQDSPGVGVVGVEPPRQGRVRKSNHSICTKHLAGQISDPSTSSRDVRPEAQMYVQMGANCSFSAASVVHPSLPSLQGLIYPFHTGSGHRAASPTYSGSMLWPNSSPPFSGAGGNCSCHPSALGHCPQLIIVHFWVPIGG